MIFERDPVAAAALPPTDFFSYAAAAVSFQARHPLLRRCGTSLSLSLWSAHGAGRRRTSEAPHPATEAEAEDKGGAGEGAVSGAVLLLLLTLALAPLVLYGGSPISRSLSLSGYVARMLCFCLRIWLISL